MATTTATIGEKEYVLPPRRGFEPMRIDQQPIRLLPHPPRDAAGGYDAIAYARHATARDVHHWMTASGLSLQALARRGRISEPVLGRVLSGERHVSVPLAERLDRLTHQRAVKALA